MRFIFQIAGSVNLNLRSAGLMVEFYLKGAILPGECDVACDDRRARFIIKRRLKRSPILRISSNEASRVGLSGRRLNFCRAGDNGGHSVFRFREPVFQGEPTLAGLRISCCNYCNCFTWFPLF